MIFCRATYIRVLLCVEVEVVYLSSVTFCLNKYAFLPVANSENLVVMVWLDSAMDNANDGLQGSYRNPLSGEFRFSKLF